MYFVTKFSIICPIFPLSILKFDLLLNNADVLVDIKQKIPVIYILSNGRSGSTLLDLLLGLHPNIWTLGEAQILPLEFRENRLPCGCGQSIYDCPFWQNLKPNLPLEHSPFPIEYFREHHTGGKVIRYNHLYDMFIKKNVSKSNLKGMRIYADLNARYFSEVKHYVEACERVEIKWLVDASKDIYRLYWLLESGEFDIKVIHLVKDPRAFVYSMTKDHPAKTNKTIRFAGRWLVENRTLFFIVKES